MDDLGFLERKVNALKQNIALDPELTDKFKDQASASLQKQLDYLRNPTKEGLLDLLNEVDDYVKNLDLLFKQAFDNLESCQNNIPLMKLEINSLPQYVGLSKETSTIKN